MASAKGPASSKVISPPLEKLISSWSIRGSKFWLLLPRETTLKNRLFHSSPWDPLKHLLWFNLSLISFTAYPDFLHFLTDCAHKRLFDKIPSCKSPLQSLFLGNNDRTLFFLVFSKLFDNNSLLFLFSFIANNSSLFDFTLCILVSD